MKAIRWALGLLILSFSVMTWSRGDTPFPLNLPIGSWVTEDSGLIVNIGPHENQDRTLKIQILSKRASNVIAAGYVQKILPDGSMIARVRDNQSVIWSAFMRVDESGILHLHLGNESQQLDLDMRQQE